jgi:hypothetical protein
MAAQWRLQVTWTGSMDIPLPIPPLGTDDLSGRGCQVLWWSGRACVNPDLHFLVRGLALGAFSVQWDHDAPQLEAMGRNVDSVRHQPSACSGVGVMLELWLHTLDTGTL